MNKKQIMIAVGAVVMIGVGATAYALSGPKLELKTNKVNVEYGTTYTPKLKDIVKDYKDLNKDDLEIINKIPNEKDKTYPAVGKYSITVKYKKKSLKQSVIVKDTKAPEFVLPANMELLQGTGLDTLDYNFLKSLMNISDLSEISIEIDTSKIDINTPGQYDFNVTVKDKYNNETKKTGKVTVIAKPVISNNEEVVHETVKNKDGTTSVKTRVQKKQSSNTTNSSNNNNSNSSGSNNNSNSSSNSSSSRSNKGSMTYEDNPKYHWEGDHSYGDGAELKGEDFDKLTGGDWKNWNY